MDNSQMTKIQVKLQKASGDEVVDAILNEDEDQLNARLVRLAKHENETETALKEDEDVLRLKDELKNAQGPYKDALKGIKLQRRFVAMRLEEVGSSVKSSDDTGN